MFFKFTIYRKNQEDPKIFFPGQKVPAKKVEEGMTRKGKPTKRSRRQQLNIYVGIIKSELMQFAFLIGSKFLL